MPLEFYINNNQAQPITQTACNFPVGSIPETTISAKSRCPVVTLPDGNGYTVTYQGGGQIFSVTFDTEYGGVSNVHYQGFIPDGACQPPNWWVDT